jgi:hypothetical protein
VLLICSTVVDVYVWKIRTVSYNSYYNVTAQQVRRNRRYEKGADGLCVRLTEKYVWYKVDMEGVMKFNICALCLVFV